MNKIGPRKEPCGTPKGRSYQDDDLCLCLCLFYALSLTMFLMLVLLLIAQALSNAIDLFGVYILFSQYRSCDNTQEVWSFVLFIKMRACKHEHACMHSYY